MLVISGLPAPPQDSHANLPALPGLGELLRLADPGTSDHDWRSGLLRDLGAAEWANEAPAAVAAASLPIRPGTGVCLAVPAHAMIGISRVHLHAAPLQLDPVHMAAFAVAFEAQFGDEARLHTVGNGWLMEAACAVAASDDDPLHLLGQPLERLAAQSVEQRRLRRLGAEIEMWLADLPINAERVKRGQLPVNLLWLWGGGRVRGLALPPGSSSLRLHAQQGDAWLAGCAALTGATMSPLDGGWQAVKHPQDSVIVLQVTAMTDAAQWLRWDEQWFQPLLRDLHARRINALTLRFGRRALQVRRRLWSAPWRRRRPWWQVATA